MGFGILAKSENSLTNFSICLIWLLIIFKLSLKLSWSLSSSWFEYLFFNISIVNKIINDHSGDIKFKSKYEGAEVKIIFRK